jgi:hypothetical protein
MTCIIKQSARIINPTHRRGKIEVLCYRGEQLIMKLPTSSVREADMLYSLWVSGATQARMAEWIKS